MVRLMTALPAGTECRWVDAMDGELQATPGSAYGCVDTDRRQASSQGKGGRRDEDEISNMERNACGTAMAMAGGARASVRRIRVFPAGLQWASDECASYLRL